MKVRGRITVFTNHANLIVHRRKSDVLANDKDPNILSLGKHENDHTAWAYADKSRQKCRDRQVLKCTGRKMIYPGSFSNRSQVFRPTSFTVQLQASLSGPVLREGKSLAGNGGLE